MKLIQTSIVAGLAFFLSAGISFGAEMDDLDVTIRVVGSDDMIEMHNELSLPDMLSDVASAPAEDGERGLVHANDTQGHKQETELEHEDSDEARDEREDEIEDHDEAHEDKSDVDDEHGEVTEEEKHEEDHALGNP